MAIYQLLSSVFTVLLMLHVCTAYDNCKDWKRSIPYIGSGEYLVGNGHGQYHKVYCEFYNNHGYMFIPKDISADVNMALLNPSTSKVLVRHRRKDNTQFETTLTQMRKYSKLPLSIQYNAHDNYQGPINGKRLGPYLFLGFLPKSVASQKTTQGYRVNNFDVTFKNCDANGNSYMAFFFDRNNGTPDGYYKRCCYNQRMRKWADLGTPTTHTLSHEYFLQTEMHLGGCGGYSLTGLKTQADIHGVALGMYFDL